MTHRRTRARRAAARLRNGHRVGLVAMLLVGAVAAWRPAPTVARPSQAREARALSFESLGTFGGSVTGVVVSDTLAFASRGDRLDVLDVANPDAPRVLATSGALGSDAPVEAVGAGRAYAVQRERRGDRSTWYDELLAIDVTDPLAPHPAGTLRQPAHAFAALLVDGTLLYAASGDAGLGVYSTADLAAPRRVSTVDLGGSATGIAALDGRLLVATTDAAGVGRLVVVEPGAPGEPPSVVGRLEVGLQTGLVGRAGHFALVESYQRNADGTRSGGTVLVDVAEPARPHIAGHLGWSNVLAFAASADRLFALQGPHAVRDALRLTSIETGRLPEIASAEQRLIWGGGIDVAGGRLLMAADARGLVTYGDAGVDDGGAWIETGGLPTLGQPMGMALDDGRAFVTDADDELWALDVRAGAAPTVLGRGALEHPVPELLRGIRGGPLVVRGQTAYVVRMNDGSISGGVHVFDVSDPTRPTQVGLWDAYVESVGNPRYYDDFYPSPSQPTLDGDRLWIPGRPALTELDVLDPAQPRLVAHSELPFVQDAHVAFGHDTSGMLAEGRRVVAAAYRGGLFAADVSADGTLDLVGRARMPGVARDVARVGAHLLVAGDWGTGLRVLDAATLDAVRAIEGIDGLSVVVADDTAYVVAREGVVAVDVADPSLPVVRGALARPFDELDAQIAVDGDRLLLARADRGLELVRLVPGEALPAPTVGPTLTPWPTPTAGTEPPRITPLPTATPRGTGTAPPPTADLPVTPTPIARPTSGATEGPGVGAGRVLLPAAFAGG